MMLVYELKQIPDLTLNKYAVFNNGGVEGVISEHTSFWHQLNRRGMMLEERYHLIYEYNPKKKKGNRLCVRFMIEQEDDKDNYAEETIKSCSLSSYFDLRRVSYEESQEDITEYKYAVHLKKRERFLKPLNDIYSELFYYMINPWKMNENGRLYGMLKLMELINKPCAYCITLYPVDYSEQAEEDLAVIMTKLRKAVKTQVRSSSYGTSLSEKDMNADRVLDVYEDILNALSENPHFFIDIQTWADDREATRLLMDAAASEALLEGNYGVVEDENGPFSLKKLQKRYFRLYSDSHAPENLAYLPQLFTLSEILPFSMFPALYPGECIEIPKETMPKPVESGLNLGKTKEGHEIYFPLENMSKHAFLAGVPGSGKTNSMMHLAACLVKKKIPILILEPAKHEYRGLVTVEGLKHISVFSPGAATCFPLHINPFEFPERMTLAEHIRNLMEVFKGAFTLEAPMPFLLDSAVEAVYRDKGWLPSMKNDGTLKYPTMRDLYVKLEKLIEETDYDGELKGNLKSALQVRIGSLLIREMGDVFDVSKSTFKPNTWLKKSIIIELESMGHEPANFLTLLLSTLIRETLKIENYDKKKWNGGPRHVIFFEEAHNLIGPSAQVAPGEEADPKLAATEFIVRMLAEVRALGEGIVIADQLPTSMAPQVLKNTSLKIGLRITAQDDKEMLGSTMSADSLQLERMGIFSPGHALVSYEPLLKPFEVQIPEFIVQKGDVSDSQVILNTMEEKVYYNNILKSIGIRIDRIERRFQEFLQKSAQKNTKWEVFYQNFNLIQDIYFETLDIEKNILYVLESFEENNNSEEILKLKDTKEYISNIGRKYYSYIQKFLDEKSSIGFTQDVGGIYYTKGMNNFRIRMGMYEKELNKR